MAYNKSNMKGVMANYSHLRTLPALLSIIFAGMSLYLFGGISEIHIPWFGYTLTTQHALLGSLGIYVIAFASSETKAFAAYEDWEKVMIGVPPVVMLAHQFTNFVPNQMATYDPWLAIGFFLMSVVGWSVAVR